MYVGCSGIDRILQELIDEANNGSTEGQLPQMLNIIRSVGILRGRDPWVWPFIPRQIGDCCFDVLCQGNLWRDLAIGGKPDGADCE